MRILVAALLLALMAGCATTGGGTTVDRRSPSRKLKAAVELLGKGDSASARKLLASVTEAPPVAGVTDEALFRLALLSLKPAEPRESHQLLRRLKREFPTSPWNVQAQPLVEYMGGADEVRRQNRSAKANNQALTKEVETLKSNNQTLVRENEELKKGIEKLKHLDVELERKTR